MATKVVLHVGTMKSGTSFLQNVLGHNKDPLSEAGVLFPGPRWQFQVRAVRELMAYGGPKQDPMPESGPWRRMVEEIHAWPGSAVVSMEFLGPRPAAKIAQIAADLPDTPVEAIITCRDLGRTIPAMWQESVQNGGTTPWPDYVAAVRHRRRSDRVSRNFWRQQDVPAMADRWAGVLGEDALTLVTVPPSGTDPSVLWRRFAAAADFDPEGADLDVLANPSIGLASAQLLLRLNQRYHAEHGEMPAHYDPYVKHKLAKRGLVHRSGEGRLGFDERWAVTFGEAQIDQLQRSGHRVIGDLHDLLPVPVRGGNPADIPAEELLDAALDGIEIVLSGWESADRAARRKRRKQRKRRKRTGDTP